MATGKTRPVVPANRQHGAALLVLLTIIVLAASYTLLQRVNREPVKILRAANDSRVLGEAKTAIVGYALSATAPINQPGRLPCPDYGTDGNFDGQSDTCDEQVNFVSIGRLPWQTLGLADLRDSAGEQLWYSPALELDGNQPQPINSETTTSLRLDSGTRDVAAVIIAPGGILEGQVRPANMAAQGDPARYLEDANSVANVDFATQATSTATSFNDQLVVIYRDELMQAVEHRVLGEIKRYLVDYYSANGYYPYPAPLNSSVCDSSSTQGHIPVPVQGGCPSSAEWATPLPNWFTAQGWNLLVWYAPAPACIQASPGCSGAGYIDVLNTIPPTADKQAVLLAAGPAIGGQTRPPTLVSDLLDSTENTDGNTVFEELPVDAGNNDRIAIVAP